MTSEIFKQAADANNRIEFYSHLEKVLNASGAEMLVSEELKKKFGVDLVQLLKEDLLPSVQIKLAAAKQDFEKL